MGRRWSHERKQAERLTLWLEASLQQQPSRLMPSKQSQSHLEEVEAVFQTLTAAQQLAAMWSFYLSRRRREAMLQAILRRWVLQWSREELLSLARLSMQICHRLFSLVQRLLERWAVEWLEQDRQ